MTRGMALQVLYPAKAALALRAHKAAVFILLGGSRCVGSFPLGPSC